MHTEGLGCDPCNVVYHCRCLSETAETAYRGAARDTGGPRCPGCGQDLVAEPIELHDEPPDDGQRADGERCHRCGLPHGEHVLCFRLASRGSRLLAQTLDATIAVALLCLTIPLWEVHGGFMLLGALFFLGYHLFADALPGGQSLGKRFLQIAVVDDLTGAPCSVGKSVLRNVTQVFGWLDWIWIFGGRRQRAGDSLAKTRVIAARS